MLRHLACVRGPTDTVFFFSLVHGRRWSESSRSLLDRLKQKRLNSGLRSLSAHRTSGTSSSGLLRTGEGTYEDRR